MEGKRLCGRCWTLSQRNPRRAGQAMAGNNTDTHTDTQHIHRPLERRNRSSSSSSDGLFIPRERQTQDSPQTLTGHAASCRLSTKLVVAFSLSLVRLFLHSLSLFLPFWPARWQRKRVWEAAPAPARTEAGLRRIQRTPGS